MKKPLVNAAFIDGNNLHRSALDMGWKVDTGKFIRHLQEKYGVGKAYYCLGYIASMQWLYSKLEAEGYSMVYKETYRARGEVKGNIDTDLVLKAMTQYRVYKEAVIVSSDGDFGCLVKYLIEKNKLRSVIASRKDKCSPLLEKASGTYLCYLNDLSGKVGVQ